MYFRRNPTTVKGYAVRVVPAGVQVFVPHLGVEGFAFATNKSGEAPLAWDEAELKLSSPCGIKVGVMDRLDVRISPDGSRNRSSPKLLFELLDGNGQPFVEAPLVVRGGLKQGRTGPCD